MSSKSYFDAIGADWDRMRERFFSDRVRQRAYRDAAVDPAHVAADLGAGTGFITEGLLALGVRVVAVDQSPPMLEALRAKFPGAENLDCRIGSAEHLPIEDASVDRCFANMFLHHVERPAVAIREMVRILKPGGRVTITDLDRHEHEFLRTEHHDRWLGFERNQLRRWFTDAGLCDVSVESIGDECCTDSAAGEHAAIGIFVAGGRLPHDG